MYSISAIQPMKGTGNDKFREGEGGCSNEIQKLLKETMKLNWNFQRGGEMGLKK